jgi:hypothetical protein
MNQYVVVLFYASDPLSPPKVARSDGVMFINDTDVLQGETFNTRYIFDSYEKAQKVMGKYLMTSRKYTGIVTTVDELPLVLAEYKLSNT